jgi:hypothetical protein
MRTIKQVSINGVRCDFVPQDQEAFDEYVALCKAKFGSDSVSVWTVTR